VEGAKGRGFSSPHTYISSAYISGDMEFKQNKFFAAEKQIVTASPDISTVCFMLQYQQL
jgi:hypothetical protein